MKTKIILFVILVLVIFSCEEDNKVIDPIHEFVAFKGPPSINVDENLNSGTAYPLVVQLFAFAPYPEDIELSLEISTNNTVENVDFTITPRESIKIRAGKLVSDTIFVKTIDNASGNEEERSFSIQIKAVNKDIKIGLGITEPKNAVISVNILDDECSGSPLCVYNTDLNNTINGGTVNPVAVVLDKNNSKITITGDLMDYATFPSATLTLTFTPDSPGASTGSATFGEQESGTDNDGYQYKFVEVDQGTYDAVEGTISIEYDIYYMEAGAWVYWYSVTNVFSVP